MLEALEDVRLCPDLGGHLPPDGLELRPQGLERVAVLGRHRHRDVLHDQVHVLNPL